MEREELSAGATANRCGAPTDSTVSETVSESMREHWEILASSGEFSLISLGFALFYSSLNR